MSHCIIKGKWYNIDNKYLHLIRMPNVLHNQPEQIPDLDVASVVPSKKTLKRVEKFLDALSGLPSDERKALRKERKRAKKAEKLRRAAEQAGEIEDPSREAEKRTDQMEHFVVNNLDTILAILQSLIDRHSEQTITEEPTTPVSVETKEEEVEEKKEEEIKPEETKKKEEPSKSRPDWMTEEEAAIFDAAMKEEPAKKLETPLTDAEADRLADDLLGIKRPEVKELKQKEKLLVAAVKDLNANRDELIKLLETRRNDLKSNIAGSTSFLKNHNWWDRNVIGVGGLTSVVDETSLKEVEEVITTIKDIRFDLPDPARIPSKTAVDFSDMVKAGIWLEQRNMTKKAEMLKLPDSLFANAEFDAVAKAIKRDTV